jgi:hypothetical protein
MDRHMISSKIDVMPTVHDRRKEARLHLIALKMGL